MAIRNAASSERSYPTDHRTAYQDVLDASPHLVAEIIDGTVLTHPWPAIRHALASSGLHTDLSSAIQFGRVGPGGWWIIFEPELHLGQDILIPDIAGWCRERMPDYLDTAYVTLAPDWALEVLPGSTRRLDLLTKRPIYARKV